MTSPVPMYSEVFFLMLIGTRSWHILKITWFYKKLNLTRPNFKNRIRPLVFQPCCQMTWSIPKFTSPPRSSPIKIFTRTLDITKENKFFLEHKFPQNISEGDYTDQIWLPLLKSLFSSGELVIAKKDPNSAEQKVELYQKESHSIEFDIGVVEVCLSEAGNSKITDDSAKLLEEGKVNTDTLFKVTSGGVGRSWLCLQVSGLKVYISTLNYAGNDLYVGVLQNTIDFPSSIAEMNDQEKSVPLFFLMG